MGANAGRSRPAAYSTRELGPQPGDQTLRCEVTPLKPSLDFNFRFQTGYSVGVPMMQYFGAGHWWVIVTRVTPQNGTPVWLAARVRLPDVPLTTVVTDTFGGLPGGRRAIQSGLGDCSTTKAASAGSNGRSRPS